MKIQKLFLAILMLTLLAVAFFFTGQASAASACDSSYTVVKNDTLRKIAALCDTTVYALRRANPEIGSGDLIYPKQVLLLPGAVIDVPDGTDIYIVSRGDTLKSLAARFNRTVDELLGWNPDIANINVIYEGQRLVVRGGGKVPNPVPTPGKTYLIQRGDTLRIIAARFHTTVIALLKLNPQIRNQDLIFAGQVIKVPEGPASYTVLRGDTLGLIAARFGVAYTDLLELNPNITNPNLIYPGQTIRLR